MGTTTLEDQALSIGFANPQIVRTRVRVGEKFEIRGTLKNGRPYEVTYEIIELTKNSILLRMDGDFGGARIQNGTIGLPLWPNKPTKLSQVVYGQPDLYIAIIAPNESSFRLYVGGPLTLAVGEIRDTVPPPPKR